MFDSQVLDVAIGLVLMFFLLALTASSIVEAISGALQVRSTKLEQGIEQIVGKPEFIYGTSIYQALAGASTSKKARKPSYLSAKAFADAVVEAIGTAKAGVANAEQLEAALPAPLQKRLTALSHEVGSDITAVKAGLEHWFDEVMSRIAGAYKRWSQVVLFVIGLALAVGFNASATHAAGTLWHEPAVRDAVVQAARGTAAANPKASADLNAIAQQVKNVNSLGLPIGWSAWYANAGIPLTVIGWVVTAFLVLLGAPFWYGLLTQLVSLRSSGNKPPTAADDPTSATRAQSTPPAPAPPAITVAVAPAAEAAAVAPVAAAAVVAPVAEAPGLDEPPVPPLHALLDLTALGTYGAQP